MPGKGSKCGTRPSSQTASGCRHFLPGWHHAARWHGCLRPRRRGVAGGRAAARRGRGGGPAAGRGRARACSSPTTRARPVADQEAKLARLGIPAAGDVLTSAMAAARLVEPGERVLVVRRARRRRGPGGPGRRAGRATATPTWSSSGFHRDFDYERLRVAARRGAAGRPPHRHQRRRHLPDARRARSPAAGSLLAAVAYAPGATPVVAGKPHPPMADLVRAPSAAADGTVVGDRPDTDGVLGRPARLPLRARAHRGDRPRRPAGRPRRRTSWPTTWPRWCPAVSSGRRAASGGGDGGGQPPYGIRGARVRPVAPAERRARGARRARRTRTRRRGPPRPRRRWDR